VSHVKSPLKFNGDSYPKNHIFLNYKFLHNAYFILLCDIVIPTEFYVIINKKRSSKMQTIQIDTALYNKLVEAGIDIEEELQKLVDGFVSDVKVPYGKKPLLTKEEIRKTVENSQRIEGYEPASLEIQEEAKALMKKHNVKVSF